MLQTGILRTWNDDRGFGFIAPTQGGEKLFVHISAFSHDGTRPTVGESLSYLLGRGNDGKPKATKVVRVASVDKAGAARVAARRGPQTMSWVGSMLLVTLVVSGIAVGYSKYKSPERRLARLAFESSPAPLALSPAERDFARTLRCDGQTMCFQMDSCTDAKWFTSSCPDTHKDGNRDGTPCGQQSCTDSFSGRE
jgi:cold shock CspA family protein